MNKIGLFYFLIISFSGFSQGRYAADRYFEEYAYKKSAELYEIIYNKGDRSMLVISRLGDANYYNANVTEAEKWYRLLFEKYEVNASIEQMFRYAQVLKSNGKVEESNTWLRKLKNINKTDYRALALEKNENYFAEYSTKRKDSVSIQNLSINTKYSDFGIFTYNNRIYFASDKPEGSEPDKNLYKWNEKPFLNIYAASVDYNDIEKGIQVSTPGKLTSLNTRYHESSPILTSDGKTIYFTRANYDGNKLKADKNRITHLKIYKATLINGTWSNIEELPFNNDEYSCGHPALSTDEKTLYFVSDMPGGIGSTDIYKVNINDDGSYGEVIHLGRPVNTEGREMFLTIDDEDTIYFASDGHLGLGALDIFETKYVDDKFTEPVNLGAPINGPLDDFSFVISEDKSYGYFSSNRKGGKGDDDIYSFVIKKLKKDIEGYITDSRTGEPIPEVLVRLIDENNTPIRKQITKEDGKYVFKDVEYDNDYTVTASKDDYRSNQKGTAKEGNQKGKTDLTLESLIVDDPTGNGAQIVIRPIYFDFDSYAIHEKAEYELEQIVSVMKNHPEMVIRIESHSDSWGSNKYNRILSNKRAASTRDYLISRKISPGRIESAIGYGEYKLLNDCGDKNQRKCTEAQHQKNRRSFFYIVDKKREEEEKAKIIEQGYYELLPKDTLYSISKRFGITVKKLKELNNLESNEVIIGQRLRIR